MVILAGDHIYKMDYELMLQQHVNSGADVTVGCLEVPRMEATGFGVMHVNDTDRIIDFVEKPADPPGCRTIRTWPWPRWGSTCSTPIS
jgi:glucose-1-phosphate adenylyltransferase